MKTHRITASTGWAHPSSAEAVSLSLQQLDEHAQECDRPPQRPSYRISCKQQTNSPFVSRDALN